MNTLTKLVAPIVFGVALVAALLVPIAQTADAQGSNQNNQQNNSQNQKAEVTYKYVAQAGDSYSKIARKAIQTYGIKNKVNLSQAQIIFAETNLTKEAGSPFLNKGQAVELKEAAVKGWVDKAKELSQEKQSAWAKYTAGVNFNTDKVGQQ